MDGQYKVGYTRKGVAIFLENTRLNACKQWYFSEADAVAIANALMEARRQASNLEPQPLFVYVATI